MIFGRITVDKLNPPIGSDTYSIMHHPDYYLVIDLEATCSEDNSVPRNEMEIIEIGAVMVESMTYDVIDEFQTFVRPVRHSRLTHFCKDLTTIRQIEVDIAPPFPQAMQDMQRWLRAYPHALFCSWGNYDKVQFERDCFFHRVAYPFGKRHLNLKTEFAKAQALRKPVGMTVALRQVGMSVRGTHHRGIDDARNIARLLPFIQ